MGALALTTSKVVHGTPSLNSYCHTHLLESNKGPGSVIVVIRYRRLTMCAHRETVLQSYRRELLKGSTETLILSLLSEESMYGYMLVKEIDRRSNGYFQLKEGTLYPALHRLERDGLVEGEWEEAKSGQSRRYYHITALGSERLDCLRREWDLFTAAVNRIAHSVEAHTNGVMVGT